MMLAKQIKCHSSNEEAVQSILAAVEAAVRASLLAVDYAEYRDTIRVDETRYPTGKNTLVITLDGGSPEVELTIDYGGCCG